MRFAPIAVGLALLSTSALAQQAAPPSGPPPGQTGPSSPVQPSPQTAEQALATIGLNDLITRLNNYTQKISCPSGQEKCELRVSVQGGQITAVSPIGMTEAPAATTPAPSK